MGYIREPDGITLLVEKQNLTKEVENRIKDFILKSKQKNRDLLKKIKLKKENERGK